MQQVEQYHKQIATQFILLQILETRHFNIMVIHGTLLGGLFALIFQPDLVVKIAILK